MTRKHKKRSQGEQAGPSQGSVSGVLEKAADVGSSLPAHPVQAWQSAREGTQELAAALPEVKGLEQVKDFIRRYPAAATCAALILGYMIFGTTWPVLGRAARLVRGR
jgi:hypothetical protein